MQTLFQNFDTFTLLAVAVMALLTSTVHGATGVAGGFLLSAALAPVIGVAPIVPVVSVPIYIDFGHSGKIFAHLQTDARLQPSDVATSKSFSKRKPFGSRHISLGVIFSRSVLFSS